MLAVLVPSRGRPNNLRRLVDAIHATATGHVTVMTRIDDDDPAHDGYAGIADATLTGPRIFYGASINQLAEYAMNCRASHLAMFGDDVLPETVGWDQLLIDALGDSLGIAYGSDGLEHLHGPDLPTHFITQTDLYRRLGWLVLPTLRHLYADDVAREIGRGLNNLTYLPTVSLRHLHRWAKLAPDDQTYREANDKRKREQDRRAYLAWRNGPGYIESMRALGVDL